MKCFSPKTGHIIWSGNLTVQLYTTDGIPQERLPKKLFLVFFCFWDLFWNQTLLIQVIQLFLTTLSRYSCSFWLYFLVRGLTFKLVLFLGGPSSHLAPSYPLTPACPVWDWVRPLRLEARVYLGAQRKTVGFRAPRVKESSAADAQKQKGGCSDARAGTGHLTFCERSGWRLWRCSLLLGRSCCASCWHPPQPRWVNELVRLCALLSWISIGASVDAALLLKKRRCCKLCPRNKAFKSQYRARFGVEMNFKGVFWADIS